MSSMLARGIRKKMKYTIVVDDLSNMLVAGSNKYIFPIGGSF